jgi:hypothetical protein
VLNETRTVKVGDVAVIVKDLPRAPEELTVVPAQPGEVATGAPSPLAARPAAAAPWARTRGGLSLGWRRTWDETEAGFDFEQRTVRLDLTAWDLGRRPYRFEVRLRTREDLRHRDTDAFDVPRDERRDRIYALSLRYEPPEGRFSWALGRLGATPAAIGFLDGGLLEMRLNGPLRLGGFFGRRSEIQSDDLDEAGQKYGGFLRVSPPLRGAAWDFTLTGVRETAGDDVSREYAGLQGRFAKGAFSSWQWVELDFNRDWREELAAESVQLSNLSLAGAYRFSSSTSAALSYDRRRNYRTAETRSVPEELFDRFVRQGLRASVDVTPTKGVGLRAFVNWREREGETDDALAYGAGMRLPTPAETQLSLDAAGFSNGVTSGVQGFVTLARRFRQAHALLAYDLSTFTLDAEDGTRYTNHSLRLSVRGDVGRHVWLLGEVEMEKGDESEGPRVWVEAGYRF